jgi:hypothetical protein
MVVVLLVMARSSAGLVKDASTGGKDSVAGKFLERRILCRLAIVLRSGL